MLIKLIVAMTPDRLIGRDGTLPWHEPADLKNFKRLTTGHAIIMGRRTFESIGKPLPGRRNIVLTRREQGDAGPPTDATTQLDFAPSLKDALDLCEKRGESTAYAIGGASVFAEALPLADELIITWIDQPGLTGDTWFPEWNRADWIAGESSALSATARVVHYRRAT